MEAEINLGKQQRRIKCKSSSAIFQAGRGDKGSCFWQHLGGCRGTS